MRSLPELQFLNDVTRQLLMCLRQQQMDNYDSVRFSFDGVDRSSVFNLEYHQENLSFFIANHDRFQVIWSLFEDQTSRNLFIELILWRLAGHLHVKLSKNTPRYWKLIEEALSIPSQPSHFDFRGLFGPLKHFENIQFCDRRLALDCWPGSLAYTFLIKQYFFERENVRIGPARHNHVVDAGSLFGDTAVAFATAVGEEGRVYAFDPLASHSEIVLHNIAQNGLDDRIRFFPVGLGAFPNEVPGPVKQEKIVNPGFSLYGAAESTNIPIRTVDDLVAAGDIARVDFLKMDIEGSELAALQGAERTLREFKPKLAISVYHKFSDLFEIPSFIRDLNLGYRFYLDHYTIHAEETVLYADAA
jgi:FkbM family methyltransferase